MGAARIYSAFTPYFHTMTVDLDYAQSADVVYLAHLDYPLYKATRSDHTDWTFEAVTFGPTIATPAAPTGLASSPNMTGYVATNYSYKVTAVGGSPEEESRASTSLTLVNDLTLTGNYNTLTMPALPAGGERFIVYKEQGGAYGYIGGTDGTTFVDGNPQIQAVLSDTPPTAQNPFDSDRNYPSTLTFHEQRLVLARTWNTPNGIWGSQSSNFENMDVARPANPDDAYALALVAEKVNAVNMLASMDDLVALTADGIFAINGGEGGAITPSSIVPKRQSSRGSTRLKPIVLDSIIFYRPNKGSTVRTLGFSFEVDGYKSNNVAIFSPHLLDSHDITSWTYLEEPYSCIVASRDDGALLFFTWEQEQQVWGWSLCETNGFVEQVMAISEGGYDRLYAVIRRDINGIERKFHERMALPHTDDITLACHLDCSVTQVYDPPRNVVSGLHHLEGELVSAYYDGYVANDLLVEVGQITLPNDYAATVVTVGMPYVGEIETLPLVLRTDSGTAHTNKQNIGSVTVRTLDTRGIEVGIRGADLEAIPDREGDEDGLADVAERDYEVSPPGSWDSSQTLVIQQNQPLPAHITGVFIEPKVSPK